jgi:hypothetical protein
MLDCAAGAEMLRVGAARGILAGFAFFRATFVAVFGLRGALVPLIRRFRGAALAATRFVAFRRGGLAALRALLRTVGVFLRTVFLRTVVLRLAMTLA